jgi:hypothetical protein
MFGLTKLYNALNALAENVLALAGTVAEVNRGLRRRLALDTPEGAAQPGEVIDQPPAAEALPAPRRNGKKATA